jgi:hypothetical protein
MELVSVAEDAAFDANAKRGLQEELQQGRGVDNHHANSRSSRMRAAAEVLSVTLLRP